MPTKAKKKTGLGQNHLDWIQNTASEARQTSKLLELSLDHVVESEALKLRLELPDIERLAQDIAQRGQTTPAFVRPLPDGQYELISGYRRLAALRTLKSEVILARVFPDLSDVETERLAISENLQRKNLSDLELAQICLRLQQQKLSVKEISQITAKRDRTVSLYLAVAKAPQPIRDALHQERLSLYIAYELVQACKRKETAYVCSPPESLIALIETIVEQELSVRQVQEYLQQLAEENAPEAVEPAPSASTKTRSPFQPIRVREKKNGFDLVIKYRRREDVATIIETLENMLERLRTEQKNPPG